MKMRDTKLMKNSIKNKVKIKIYCFQILSSTWVLKLHDTHLSTLFLPLVVKSNLKITTQQ
jgi:hypothetical protein